MVNSNSRSHRAACADRSLHRFLRILYQCIDGEGEAPPGSEYCFGAYGTGLSDQSLEPDAFRVAYLKENIMRKYLARNADQTLLRDAALKALFEAEEHCVTSYHTYKRRPREVSSLSVDGIFHSAQRKIRACLGVFSWHECFTRSDFGPGSTTSLPRRFGDVYYKVGVLPDVSSDAVPLVNEFISRYRPLWGEHLVQRHGRWFNICDVNRITTVPKDSKTDRPIAIEPQWNMFFQKGIGEMIRSRLRSVGVNLNDQTRNQELARLGSIDGSLATIDLSSASDTMAQWLVTELLPPQWTSALEQVRCRYGTLNYPGWPEKVFYRKFSSMGNGSTFELESLIFWALATSVVEALGAEARHVSVYGDDIIVPSTSANQVCEILRWAGFIPNPKKTHITGSFRESCGKHYLAGHDVSPFFIRHPLDNPIDWVVLHNNLTLWSMQRYSSCRDAAVLPALNYIRAVGSEWRVPCVPPELGAAGWLTSFDEACPLTFRRWNKSKQSVEYVVRRCLVSNQKLLNGKQGVQRLLRSLHVLERQVGQGPNDPSFVPTRAQGYRRKKIRVSSWTDIPPFLNFDNGENHESIGSYLQAF